ncbi:DNA polymerase III subunit gamma/tau [Pseudidiomarina tainanensis]|uniref:DNA polymerase III subunit gamma/tau n=1 Tax=Pseudidiomarina tainanensis TaxID=502365 RepID=A0ACD2HK42_9GAMM|nr:DNA polymerase III subunit gamma/tau [Pseudidiomarina tainanensis]RZQ56549.1 DNA polymerase III subunit gamma/tau [Pseudidiomarina tainanensis]
MSYQVLARKWRPRNFAEVVGQQHVLKPLFNALQTGRLHHAWLLTGTRGVGKTTIARILAKSLNCEQGITAEPCGQCGACTAIDQGRFVDLLEIDAASRTKVEDTRELLDNVQYAPTQGRFKVYLIDEVHMLSRHSFNALLKTLEEPPEHVKFLLATTDPQKLPITVLSRCLQFNLKALSRDEITQHLMQVLGAENISFEEPAIQALARAAQGSMRDALSLTDQAIAQGDHAVTVHGVQQMLGSVPSYQLISLMQNVLSGDAETMLQTLEQVAGQVPDLSGLLPELQNLIHQMALYKAVPETAHATGLEPAGQHLAQQLPAELLQVFYDILVQGRRDLNYASDVRSGVEMTLLRLMAFRPEYLEVVEAPPEMVTKVKPVTAKTPPPSALSTPLPESQPEPEANVAEPEFEPESEYDSNDGLEDEFEPDYQAALDEAPQSQQSVTEQSQQSVTEQPAPEQAEQSPQHDLQALLATRSALAQKKNREVNTPTEDTKQPAIPAEKPAETQPVNELPEQTEAATSEPAAQAQESSEEANTPVELPEIDAQITDSTQRAAEIDRWSAMIDGLDLHGLTRQLARNSVLQKEHDQYVLMVRKNWAYLLNDGAVITIKEAMAEQFDMVLRDILVGDAEAATPVEIQQRINNHRMNVAQHTLAQDPIAQQLENEFGAQLKADSVKPD